MAAIRAHLAGKPGEQQAREALRWFYRQAKKGGDPVPHRSRGATVPPAAAADLGAEPWERALIKAARERGFLWRTEETYRGWA